MKLRRVVIGFGAFAAVILAILIGGALLLPRLMDSQLIKEKVAALLIEKTHGSATLGKIDLLWFPQPTVVVGAAEIAFDDKTKGTIRTLKVYPSIFALLRGRLVLRRAQLEEPRVKISVPAPSGKPLDIDEWEQNLRSTLTYFTTQLSGLRIDISNGSAEIKIGDKPPVTVENLEARVVTSLNGLTVQASARSNLCDRLHLQGKISQANLAAQLAIGIEQLKFKPSLASLPLQHAEYLQEGVMNFDIDLTTVGLRKITAAIDGSSGSLALMRRGEKVTVNAKKLQVNLVYDNGTTQAKVEQLELTTPRVSATAELKSAPSFSSARIQVRNLDIAEIRAVALRLADDLPAVKKLFQFVHAGTLTEIALQSGARSFAEMATSKNLVASGSMRGGSVFVPGPELNFKNVNGSLRIAGGILEAKELATNLGAVRGSDGELKLGLEGGNAPFHLAMMVQTGAAELQALLLKLVEDERIRAELVKIRNLKGELSGKVVLGDRIDAISPVVAVLKTDISASYDPIPFPVAIRGGRLSYGQSTLKLEDVQGSIGRSNLTGLNGTLRNDHSRQIKIDSARMSLDLEQADTLLGSFKGLRSHLEKLRSARGTLDLSSLTLSGVYDDPVGWNFSSAGTVRRVVIAHADLPGPVTLRRGKFTATEAKIVFSDTAATMSDASVLASGSFGYKQGDPFNLEASGTATVGAQMTQWLSRHGELPADLKLRFPLQIRAGRLAWRAGGDTAFRGQVTVAGGAQIAVEGMKSPQRLALQNLTVDDGERRAQMTLQLAKDNLDLSFKGELAQPTLDKIFLSFPWQGSSLKGDIQVRAALNTPVRFSGQGQLEGSNFWLPLGQDKALIDKFSIEASAGNVLIRSAALRWGESRLAVSGKVVGEKEGLRIDMDVSADRLSWEKLNSSFGSESNQRRDKDGGALALPAVQGTIRLKTDSFIFQRYDVRPLQMTVLFAPTGIRADVDQGIICGIKVTGQVDVAGKNIGLDLQLSATEALLEPTTVCLSVRKDEVKGTYSLKARITGRGERDDLLRSLKGTFDFSARDGEFVRAPGVDATFDYLNATGDFKVAFPDLDKEAFPYRLVSIKGRIDGEIFTGDEIIVQSSLLDVTGQGKIDLALNQIDGKGLIAVLKPVDEVLNRIPLIGSIFGGTLLGIPIRVAGPLDRPVVSYLSPGDVGTELLNIPMRILGLPMDAIRLFTPSGENRDNGISK